MNVKSTLLAAAGALSVAAPAAVHADPYDNSYYDRGWHGNGGEWRGRDRWRDDGRWRRERLHQYYGYGSGYGHGYGSRCWIEDRGHYSWSGEYVYRRVRICR
jgi:hypothetical protein